jgi:hypothetical protein
VSIDDLADGDREDSPENRNDSGDTAAHSEEPTTTGSPHEAGATRAKATKTTKAGTDRATPSRGRKIAGYLATVLSFLLIAFALTAQNRLSSLTPKAFLRIPLEGLIGLALVLILPRRVRGVVVGLAGALLGLLTIIKIVDMGFFETLSRPWDPVLDWTFVSDGLEFLNTSTGRVGEVGVVIVVITLAIALPIVMANSALRLSRIVVRHRVIAAGTLATLTAAWIVLAVGGTQLVPGVPIASKSAAGLAYGNAIQAHKALRDKKEFFAANAVDQFRDTPGNQLLTGLRGKDVLLAFVESYGRTAAEDPQVDSVLDAGTQQLKQAGYASESAWLTSSTYGGGSWLAHSTVQSGVWINNQQRYNDLVKSDRLTLSGAFRRADWRTVAVMPGLTRAWPEGGFYGYDKIYGDKDMGYQGLPFSWATMPDQYALLAFQKAERAAPNHTPVMAEIPLVSSHAPWAPIPTLIDWDAVGDGSIFAAQAKDGQSAASVWRDPDRVRAEYKRSIEYTVNTLISYVKKYGDKNLVLVFLGDHQPIPLVSGEGASRDVPITIVAKDPAVLKQISGWGWQDGIKPAPQSPVWPMSAFRDKFLTAFGSTPTK